MAANFIQRSRHDTVFCFHRRIPNDLHALGLPRQIVRFLHIADRREAAVRARGLAVAAVSLFSKIRAMAKDKTFKSDWSLTFDVDANGKPTSYTMNATKDETEAANEVLES